MKHKDHKDMLRNPDHIKPEDVAQFALFETDLNDNNKFRVLCDLIVACEQSMVRLHQSKENQELSKLREFYDLTVNKGITATDAAVQIGYLND